MRFRQTPDYPPELPMWRMMTAMELDTARAIRENRLHLDQLARMMRNCARCQDPGLCQMFLDRRTDAAVEPPSFCPNRDALIQLRQGQ